MSDFHMVVTYYRIRDVTVIIFVLCTISTSWLHMNFPAQTLHLLIWCIWTYWQYPHIWGTQIKIPAQAISLLRSAELKIGNKLNYRQFTENGWSKSMCYSTLFWFNHSSSKHSRCWSMSLTQSDIPLPFVSHLMWAVCWPVMAIVLLLYSAQPLEGQYSSSF